MLNEDPDVTVRLLRQELDSWRPFVDALREDERKAFRGLLERVWRYQEAIESSGKQYLVEPFLLSILLVQEQRIRFFQCEVARLKEEVQAWKQRQGRRTDRKSTTP